MSDIQVHLDTMAGPDPVAAWRAMRIFHERFDPAVFLGSEVPVPFKTRVAKNTMSRIVRHLQLHPASKVGSRWPVLERGCMPVLTPACPGSKGTLPGPPRTCTCTHNPISMRPRGWW